MGLNKGLTKQYLRFHPTGKLNLICCSKCNISYVKLNDKSTRYVATGGVEDVFIWDMKLGQRIGIIKGDKYRCVRLRSCPQTEQLAVGYQDGTVILYDSKTGESISTFAGHNSSITALAFDKDGHRVASGSNDTDIAVWDIVGEQGLFRLTGHKGPITQIEFMKSRNIIVSSSKDTLIKFWDLSTGYCFKTLTGHITEVWDFCLIKNDTYLVTGTNDSELRVWRIMDSTVNVKNDDNFESPIICEKSGSILRQGLGRVISMCSDDSSQIICCHGNEKMIEIFYFVTEEEAVYRYNKKRKKIRKKQVETDSVDKIDEIPPPTSLVFCVSRLPAIRTNSKVKYAAVSFENENRLRVVASLSNNSIELYSLYVKCKESVLEKIISSVGHQADVRSVAFGYDSTIISSSATDIKIWNHNTLSCIRTVDTNYVLNVCFAPGGRYALAGLKSGSFIIIDIPSGDVIETVETAHLKELWRILILPNKKGCITCGSDCTVKLWDFELLKNNDTTVLTVVHTKTLKLEEPVLDVRVTPDNNLIAAALLDSTVQIFFMDSLKFFLNLHGHKLPVTCLDISYDSTIIATGSADCSIKIWGLDYGDCHRSILAHKLAVTSLCFVPKTHHFFTCGKDGLIHRWDGDNYERIQTLQGHHGEAWCLSVSSDGFYVVSCGQDRVIRIYEKSDEPLVLEDERETERQVEEETTLATGEHSAIQGRTAMVLASKKTVKAEKGAELLLECLDIIKEYKKSLLQEKTTPLPIILLAFNAKTMDEYLLAILRKIRSSDLEEILSLLSLSSVTELIQNLVPLLKTMNPDIELTVRVLVFLLRAHHKPIVSSQNLYLILKQLNVISIKRVNELRNLVGYNFHALYYLQKQREK